LAQKIKVGAVSYLNTKPLIYGFEQGMMKEELELLIDYPANIAKKLLHDEIDIGLVPVAIIPSMQNHYVVSHYCIGCFGEVASVGLFSDVPLGQVETILLDYQSASSVQLLKILLKEYWHIAPSIVPATIAYEENIRGTVAGLVIGDRAFKQRKRSTYFYDLGLAWKELTGLPFVFAAWLSNKEIGGSFLHRFDMACAAGLDQLPLVIKSNASNYYDLQTYYTKNVSYVLDENLKKGMDLFLEKIKGQ
jgi:chorismate dehydratase